MRIATCLAALGLVRGLTVAGILAASTAPASAQEWCGFHDKTGSKVRCGYSSMDECKQQIGGKDAVCLPSPSFAREQRRTVAFRNG
jgi:hypothetical protein